MLVVVGDILVGAGSSEGLLSPECGDRRTVLAVVTLLLLAPLVSARCALASEKRGLWCTASGAAAAACRWLSTQPFS